MNSLLFWRRPRSKRKNNRSKALSHEPAQRHQLFPQSGRRIRRVLCAGSRGPRRRPRVQETERREALAIGAFSGGCPNQAAARGARRKGHSAVQSAATETGTTTFPSVEEAGTQAATS